MRSPRPSSAGAPAKSSRVPLAPLLLAFVLSGAAGLVYETIWSRYLGLLVGHSAYAQVVVLVLFMGGMAGGALLVGNRSERLRDPLLLYAIVEAVIGVIGLLFHPVFVGVTDLAYEGWFPALGGTPWVSVVKWGLAVPLILPQSILLGATFPLMSAGVIRRSPKRPGQTLAVLYFANSLGAAAGCLLAGFFLVRVAGLPGTMIAAAVLNLLVALLVIAVTRRARAPRPAGVGAPRQAIEAEPVGAPRPPWPAHATLLLAVSFGTAVASFVYEIAWIRMLSLVLGSATHSFELMLSAFILGLALGALWTRSRADRFRDPIRALAITQLAMGALALATLPLYAFSFQWMAGLVARLQEAPNGYETFSLARYAVCLAVMLPATFCAGVTLPLITRVLMTTGGGERAIGVVYGVNTLGSIVGAALAGLVLLPWLGLERLLAAGALVDMGLGVALLWRGEPAARRLALPALGGALAMTLGWTALVRLDPLVLVSGVYRTGELLDPQATRVVFYRDGRTATVSVREQTNGALTLSTNGKPDASLPARWRSTEPTRPAALEDDESTQLLLALVTVAHAPTAERAAVVGQGSGITSHTLLGSRHLRDVVTIEIEPEMIAASRAFLPANRRVFEDPRSRFAIDDARSYFAATGERFDVIVSEPSNPWVSGVAGLFTEEFYERVKATLGDHGVLGQWLHIYSLDDDLALGVLAAIHRHFADYRAYMVSSTDMLIVASNRAGGLRPDWSVFADPGYASELRRVHPFTTRILDALRVADRATLAPLLERMAPNSDFFPALDLGAERARFESRSATGILRLHEERFGIAALGAPPVDPPPDVFVPLSGPTRVRGLMWVARLRLALAGLPPPGPDPEDFAARLPQAIERQRSILSTIGSGAPPGDWRQWQLEVLRAEYERHAGTSGWADESWFQQLRSYVRQRNAPQVVEHTIDWVHALDRRDYARAAALSDSLVDFAIGREAWLAPGLLVDGGVMAKLAIGDEDGAARIHRALAPHLTRPPEELRRRLMEAWLARLDPSR